MTAKELFEKIYKQAKEFGLRAKNEHKEIINAGGNAIIRNNLSKNSFNENEAYFGFISSKEDTSGIYSDFSLVIFPDNFDNVRYCVVALGVGSAGFKNDYELAVLPGLRRTFLKLRTDDNTFFKTTFDDIESPSKDLLNEVKEKCPDLTNVISSYKTVLPASCIVNLEEEGNEKGFNTLYTWLATYAKIRNWATNNNQRKVRDNVLKKINTTKERQEINEIKQLLERRKYVVLQGAPGTGKTYSALKIAESYSEIFFTQFHADITYTDFIYGIEPNLEQGQDKPQFTKKEGELYKAIEYAKTCPDKKVLLIIDEINRANLSNVLGPVFYLFEHQAKTRSTYLKIGDLKIEKLPDNLHVIATMNTADRSLAVVDFALRRRFAWYTLRPRKIKADEGYIFMEETYNKIADIFYEYATDDELNLQPGQSYFIVPTSNNNKDEKEIMKERIIYELMPLIKEYLAEGYLLKAKDSFFDFFLKETDILMYE